MKKRKIPFYTVDVFAESKYSGNQLAVFPDSGLLSSDEMQKIARETNFSETTFITSVDSVKKVAAVRIFTPEAEIPFAGHPTLGTAYIVNNLFFKGVADLVTLDLKVGKIPVLFKGEILWMKQVQPDFGPELEPEQMAMALGINIDLIDTFFPVLPVSTGMYFYIVPLRSLEALRNITIDNSRMMHYLGNTITQQVLVFSGECYNDIDAISCRVFVPNMGIPEDPATGSANGCLAAYLLKEGYFGSKSIELSVAQGYEMNRPSRLYLDAQLENEIYKTNVGGRVVEISEGKWY
jgi:trans-2,3-dihydro-3-hydroxyanthranilate isomerase